MSRIDCETCKELMTSFFADTLSDSTNLIICEHLFKCEKCRQHYATALKKLLGGNLNLDFYLASKKERADSKDKPLEEKDTVNDTRKLGAIDEVKNKQEAYVQGFWLNNFKDDNYFGLSNAQSIRDVTIDAMGINSPAMLWYENDSEKLEFTKFLIKKVCQRLDHLEHCFTLPLADKGDK